MTLTSIPRDSSKKSIRSTSLEIRDTPSDVTFDYNPYVRLRLKNTHIVLLSYAEGTQKVLSTQTPSLPLFTITPYSSIKKLIFVFDLFSPPSPSITRTLPPLLTKFLIAFISISVNLLLGPGNTKTLPLLNDSSLMVSLFLPKITRRSGQKLRLGARTARKGHDRSNLLTRPISILASIFSATL